jgi:hypothetical protein
MYISSFALPSLARSFFAGGSSGGSGSSSSGSGGGRIIAVGSMAGKQGLPRVAPYAASKHAVFGYFDSLRQVVVFRIGVTISRARMPQCISFFFFFFFFLFFHSMPLCAAAVVPPLYLVPASYLFHILFPSFWTSLFFSSLKKIKKIYIKIKDLAASVGKPESESLRAITITTGVLGSFGTDTARATTKVGHVLIWVWREERGGGEGRKGGRYIERRQWPIWALISIYHPNQH